MDRVQIGPFRVLDLDQRGLVDHIVDTAVTEGRRRVVSAFALHVEGLNRREHPGFVEAMNEADIVYADGGSVVWLGRRAGAERLERAVTTDIGWDVLRGMAERLGRTPRTAFLGGPPGLAREAATVLEEAGVADPVAVHHGYHQAWHGHVRRLREARPDVTVVGMGVPHEMLWAHQWSPELPPGLVLTCGGWFGYLTGRERRAPAPLRRPGLEWVARVAQSPGRLGSRYLKGVVTTAALARSIPTMASGPVAERLGR